MKGDSHSQGFINRNLSSSNSNSYNLIIKLNSVGNDKTSDKVVEGNAFLRLTGMMAVVF